MTQQNLIRQGRNTPSHTGQDNLTGGKVLRAEKRSEKHPLPKLEVPQKH